MSSIALQSLTRYLLCFVACACLSPLAAVSVGAQAPSIGAKKSYNTPDGGPVTLAQLRGRVVLIDFWATWCGPCIAAIPHVEELHEKYHEQGLVVIGHTDASSESRGPLTGFIEKHGISYIITVGDDIGNAYGVRGIPSVFLIDPAGKVAWSGHPSGLDEQTVVKLLKQVDPAALRGGGLAGPSFAKASSNAKVAKAEASIGDGKIGRGWAELDKLAGKEESKVAAEASLAVVTKWESDQAAQIKNLIDLGDVYAAYMLADQLSDVLSGHDQRDVYRDMLKELKKDDGYKTGRDFAKLKEDAADAKASSLQKAVERFLKKYPEGFYADEAKKLLE